MSAQLVIEKLPNDYLLASMIQRNQSAPTYITSAQGKPLKFLSLAHVKEFFEGQRIEAVYLKQDQGDLQELANW